MEELKVKTETLPNRCEICHQADQFDPVERRCLRCANISESVSKLTDRIEISYNLTPKDLFKFNLYTLPRMFYLQFIAVICWLGLAYATFSSVSAPLVIKIVIALFVPILWLILLLGILFLGLFISIKAKGNKTKFTERKLILTDKFFIEETIYKRDQCNWISVQAINQNKEYIFIFDSSESAYIIPKRCFSNRGEENEFLELVNKFWQSK
jgi:hypothetical protein